MILVFACVEIVLESMIETLPGMLAISLASAEPVVTTLSSSFISMGLWVDLGVFGCAGMGSVGGVSVDCWVVCCVESSEGLCVACVGLCVESSGGSCASCALFCVCIPCSACSVWLAWASCLACVLWDCGKSCVLIAVVCVVWTCVGCSSWVECA